MMENKMVYMSIGGGVLAIVLLFVVIVLCNGVSSYNDEVSLREQVLAKQKERDTVFDTTWKIISQKAQVTDKYKDSFKEIYGDLMDKRYREGESPLVKFVQETNPDLDPNIFKDLMNTIEVQRTIFQNKQAQLIDLHREHTTLLKRFPGTLFFTLIGVKELDITIITSEKTKKAAESGEENDVEVF